MMDYLRIEAWILRAVGVVELMAFGAVIMPREWMAKSHQWMGLGDLSQAPAVEAVMRQVSFSYGLHGIDILLIASDVTRYRPLVVLTVGYLAYGMAFLFGDMRLGMPALWVAGNAGSCLLIGGLLTTLLIADAGAKRHDETRKRFGNFDFQERLSHANCLHDDPSGRDRRLDGRAVCRR